ncbi:MAG: SseB family protein [Pseudomonadota bacterium]
MTELDQLLQQTYKSQGEQSFVNKFYAAFFRTELFLPTRKEAISAEEPFSPLFTEYKQQHFMLVFDTLERLTAWAGEHVNEMHYVNIKGIDLLKGIGLNVFLGLNFGSEHYKEFAPDEIQRLKTVISKLTPSNHSQ